MSFSKRHYRLLSNADTTEAQVWRKRDAEIRVQAQTEFAAAVAAVRTTEQAALIIKQIDARIAELHAQRQS